MDKSKIEIEAVATVRSCFREKFGIPRQPGLVRSSRAEVELLPPYNRQELVVGLEEFSHIWLHFQFHQTVDAGWRETVRPPGLGGKKRVGVFACRTPHRPNHLGMSVVRLIDVKTAPGRVWLEVAGVDLLDGTPVVDIKPYVPYSDSHPEASSAYAGIFTAVTVQLSGDVENFCVSYQQQTDRDLRSLICEVLVQDPRPASQRGKRHEFGVLLWDINVRFQVLAGAATVFEVYACEQVTI